MSLYYPDPATLYASILWGGLSHALALADLGDGLLL